jgi:hypothetical protein
MEKKTGKPSSTVKKQETEHSSAAANNQEAESASSAKKKQATESSSSKAKKAETASAPSKLQVEKAVLVAVDSRRSQRVRKPKVFAELVAGVRLCTRRQKNLVWDIEW